VAQLRREDVAGTAWNLVGFQTRLTWPEQRRIFRTLPGLANAEFQRLGQVHRNTFVDAPRVLAPDLSLRSRPHLFLAGQITGVEGYVESAAVGLLVARYIDELTQHGDIKPLPYHTALGALGRHVAESSPDRYQPSNVTWALIEDVIGRAKKIEKRDRQVARAVAAVEIILRREGGALPAMDR
jgi:methylenetetrahydrofolate--tRNA-(uracil-5-)-methyltransferase